MFVDMIHKRNPNLIRAATVLHQNGSLPPNTYVIDLESLARNVQELNRVACEENINLYYMTKQIGRSGYVGKIIEQNGIKKAVAVDIDEAINLKEDGCKIGHLGHLVQPSIYQWNQVLTHLKPEVITLYSFERAKQLSDACSKLGYKQDVILKVIDREDLIYPGQFGGIHLTDLDNITKEIMRLPGITIIGLTSFPILQLNDQRENFYFTKNLQTLLKAKEILGNNGIDVRQVNAPSSTSCFTIPKLKEYGITHGEPGHSITGTTPLHAYDENQIEKPSIVYLSEISHLDQDYAYTIGGGFYARSNMENALYGKIPDQLLNQRTNVEQVSIENIDYYGCVKRKDNMNAGDSVIYSFRTQIFVTRAHVAFIRNVDSKIPEVAFFQRRGV